MKELLPNIIKDYFEIDKKNINLTFIKNVDDIKLLKNYLNDPKACLYDYVSIRLQKFHYPIMRKIKLQGRFLTFESLDEIIYSDILENQFEEFKRIALPLIKRKIERIEKTNSLSKYDPNEMYKVNDDINDEFISSINPLGFSGDRVSPLIVIDDDVLIGNNSMHHFELIEKYKEKHHLTDEDIDSDVAYENGYDQFDGKNVGVGSLFNGKVALLEYVTGKLDENNIEGQQDNSGNIKAIANTLKANGIQKVYISNTPWSSSAIYKRVAKRYLRLKLGR